jgi:putative ABC transport system permease protein
MSLLSWFRRRRRRFDLDEHDFQDEIRAHLAMAVRERMADGADRRSAEQASLKEFGNVLLTTEAARRVWTPRWLEAARDLLRDVRYAIRALAAHPGFSITVVGVLTLGIGLNATVFTMLKGIALSPIAGVEGSARLAAVYGVTSAGRDVDLSYPDYQYLRDHDDAFSGLMGTTVAGLGLGLGPRSRPIWGELVSGNYFQVLGVGAELGRTLQPSDADAPGRRPVIVLSDGLWRRDFGADPDVVGRTVTINHVALTVVGVADPAFHGTTVVYDVEAFIPVTMGPGLGFAFGSHETTPAGILGDARAAIFEPLGFMRPGVTKANAAARTNALWTARSHDRPPTDLAGRLQIVPFLQSPGGAPAIMLPSLVVLAVMGLLLLAIACANLAGLVVVRGLSRRGEIALRLALGATRIRIVRLLVVENLVLALPGALLGVLVASRAIPVFVHYADALAAPHRLFFNVQADGLVLGFAVVVACGCALVFGFVPALQSARVDLVSVMNDLSPRGPARGRLRASLMVAQVAVSLMLLVGAGLVTRSLAAARSADLGFSMDHVIGVQLDLKEDGYDDARGRAFYQRLIEAVRADPGTASATLAAYAPLAFLETPSQPVAVDGYAPRRDEDMAFLSNAVGSDYFRTLRIGLAAGRGFDDRDDERAAPVAVVNQTFAQRFWGGTAKAIGARIRIADGPWRTVVGVARDVKYIRIDEAPRPYVYVPVRQSYRPVMVLYTRGPAPVDTLVAQARAHVAALDPDLPILSARPLVGRIDGALFLFNLTATMLFVFGTAGMALAMLGTYGLVSYTVRQSTREIGIRMALGASARAVVRGFLGRGLRLGATGAALGLAAAVGVSRLVGSALYGVSPTDPVSFARALAVVLGGVTVATLVPAWRAARTDPLAALRHQ